MDLKKITNLKLPKEPGCYQFFSQKGEIIYIGKASNLQSRIKSYWQRSANHSPAKHSMMKQITQVEWIETESEIEALLLEANLIKKHQPVYNVSLRDDKRFAYIKVSIDDEIPGVFVTRKIDKAGKYFGPFTSVAPVRETLKAIRKIWPYCTERRPKKKPCFFYQVNRCLGICGGKITKKEYMEKVIRPILMFLQGKKGKIIKNYELRITNYEKELKKVKGDSEEYFELEREINGLKFFLMNMKKVLEHTNIISIGEKYAADVVELAKVLGLPRVPKRIEGYDISNIFGKEAVGSMVVFTNGEPDKNEYRKFKIKINQGLTNDVGMLKEVLERRFKHTPDVIAIRQQAEKQSRDRYVARKLASRDDSWLLPDLIIVDGGKAQRNVALRALKEAKLEIPIIAVSKGKGLRSSIAPDKIFFPEEKQALVLPLASPAMHIIKRVRDEAHRFAISFHRQLRGKKMMRK
ncbi:excinuclease ABC subunit UvrC [Patescibacteria group bacterium]